MKLYIALLAFYTINHTEHTVCIAKMYEGNEVKRAEKNRDMGCGDGRRSGRQGVMKLMMGRRR